MKNHNVDKKAFTLIELLAVVAIILLLLSLLVPALSLARERAERISCITNLDQIGKGVIAFGNDNNGYWPTSRTWMFSKKNPNINGLWAEWACDDVISNGVIHPYVNAPRMYVCPRFRRVYDEANPAAIGLTPYGSYTYNEYFQSTNLTPSWGLKLSLLRSAVQKPANQGVIGEEGTWKITQYGNYIINNMRFGAHPSPNGRIDCISNFHGPYAFDVERGFTHIWFADGHVDLRYPRDTYETMVPDLKKHGLGGY